MSCPTVTCPPLTESGPRGTQGIQGPNGNDGAPGESAWTTLVNDFTMPAVDATGLAEIVNSGWMAVGMNVYINGAGYFKVAELTTETGGFGVYLQNLGYDGNIAEGEVVLAGSLVVPAGQKGNDASAITRGYVKLVELLGQNDDAGTFTAGSWVVRQLNTLETDSKAQCTLGINGTFTLKGGFNYIIRGEAPALGVQGHMVRLYNTTDNVEVETGTSEYSHIDPSDNVFAQTRSLVIARVELSVDTDFQLQHRCGATKTGNGLGRATNLSSEVYAVVEVYEDE